MEYLAYEIMTRFPLLSASEDLKKWTGFISTKTRVILLSLLVPNFPSCRNMRMDTNEMDVKAVNFWKGVVEEIDKSSNRNFLEYLKVLEDKYFQIIGNDEGQIKVAQGPEAGSVNADMVSIITEEIEKIGVKNVQSLSPDFKEIVIRHEDRSEREHLLKLLIPVKYPDVKPKVVAELPFPPESLEWPMSIQDIFKLFVDKVDKCCKFWDDMDELDYRVKVIEPLQPNKSHCHRKILLEDNVVVHLVFSPVAPRALPQISFSGPEKMVEEFTAAMDRECKLWDESDTVMRNLRGILCCQFAEKDDDDDGENEPDPCIVCYAYNLEGEIPEIACECGSVYHKQCLQDLYVNDAEKGLRRCVKCPNCDWEIPIPTTFGFAETSW